MSTPASRPSAVSRRGVVSLAMLAAVVPTLLSAQGMVSVAIDALRFPLWAAASLAVFLELALVASALMARAAVRAGQSGRTDLAATWAFSVLSGLLSASHEAVASDGSLAVVDARMLLAGLVRLAAPLVACWIWHRVLVGDEAEGADAIPRSRQRRSRALLAVAGHALDVRRTQGTDAEVPARQLLDRAYRSVLGRHLDAHPGESVAEELDRWLHTVGDVDALPARTERVAVRQPPLAQPKGTPRPVAQRSLPSQLSQGPSRHLGDEDVMGDDGRPTGQTMAEDPSTWASVTVHDDAPRPRELDEADQVA